ncbi:Uncharacterised protein [Mycobacteroides abscessus subsp. massiliense]|uniref:hypothetical protein n=1 Tax=Mycobacteroides TaxID=670516 RepID=UPI00092C5DDA|nr:MULTISPECIES: hypothetical protein [Mycobacteroides]MBF9350603.1 hypothetical protein [Mycobacteroides chelonae]SHX44783.1 Uncharacterised protein [Mycobacteroides abscessus subsp. abscessus]SIM47911.1 Uncharacterised protein [Mycobacteroides abscessus subsp. abscessus]SKM66059.1 Uncharacterised protein [Mycobacteroides abscessus subsp. massiliense]SKN32755.1 Uncharacterised protein [Mycobacteroides abscessus subsp. massiliense]
MTLNVERLKAIRDLIKMDPEKHNQRLWAEFTGADLPKTALGTPVEVSCGTAACVAGWACQLEGDKFVISSYALLGNPDKVSADHVRTEDGEIEYIGTRATDILGMEPEQTDILFWEGWTTKQVLKILKGLIEYGEIPPKYIKKYAG